MERPITVATRVSTRVPHWEQVLADAIQQASTRPFVWGQHDCATWAFDLHRDLTNGPDHAALWRGRYRTPIGCGRVLRRLGWTSLEEGGRALLGNPLDDVRLAQRGDLILGGEPEAFGVVIGAKAAFVAPDDLVRLSLATCRLAWRT
ncbi:hypothetical protein C7964_1199 [Loktanella sp. PT4BL]|jgi:hypothetical protein|uniref:DUF6950 family protein n=1 Tax=Loktanella sp. PT4BL TaxID=2135611 RepID=UPI000D771B5E|nr:hypothetical protein [Loktanella sp. PT4BL]PXW65570.1 hypothetical protein C7964_1199 [Loktanella sp. PT4BL]